MSGRRHGPPPYGPGAGPDQSEAEEAAAWAWVDDILAGGARAAGASAPVEDLGASPPPLLPGGAACAPLAASAAAPAPSVPALLAGPALEAPAPDGPAPAGAARAAARETRAERAARLAAEAHRRTISYRATWEDDPDFAARLQPYVLPGRTLEHDDPFGGGITCLTDEDVAIAVELGERHEARLASLQEAVKPAGALTVVPPAEPPVFVAAPVRARVDGWTPERQHAFIDCLADTGSVGMAARRVGMTRESAYKLRRRPEAAAFAEAWDAATACATRVLADSALERAVHGVEVAVWRKGEIVGTRTVHSDGLAMVLLRHRDPLTYGALAGPKPYDARTLDERGPLIKRFPKLLARLLRKKKSPAPRKPKESRGEGESASSKPKPPMDSPASSTPPGSPPLPASGERAGGHPLP